jgi:hypothetical protein
MSTRWIQVASLKPLTEGPVLELGLTEGGRWVASAADNSVIDMEATGNYLPLFPLLEFSYEKAKEVLLHEFSTRGLDQAWLTVFPFEGLVAAALTSGSKFWPDLALRWIDRMRMSAPLIDALSFLVKEGKTQGSVCYQKFVINRRRRSNRSLVWRS